MNDRQSEQPDVAARGTLGRRELLTCTVPTCALACLGLGLVPRLLAADDDSDGGQEVHKFDVKTTQESSPRDRMRMQYQPFIDFIKILRNEIGDEALIRHLNAYSTALGRRVGEQHAQAAADRSFQTFTARFRPPRYADSLTHQVVEDTENAFGLRVTECVWASVFKEAGVDGAIGHAAVCNMDYTWPTAFNPKFRMERTRTLMQGHDHCNHRYVQETDGDSGGQ